MVFNSDLMQKYQIKTIYAGDCYVSNKKEIISTVLGSCIAVCLYDEVNGVSGVNHFMLPDKASKSFSNNQSNHSRLSDNSLRYGVTSMEIMINKLLSMGGDTKFLTAKVFGGANILKSNIKHSTVGEKNIHFIISYLKTKGINIISQDIGSDVGRKLFYLTKKNTVFIKKLPRALLVENKITHKGNITLSA